MKTIYSIIALLLFSLIFCSNCGCDESTDLTYPSTNTYYVTLKISGIVTGKNNNPVDTASVEIWNWLYQITNTKTNERGEYSFNKTVTINSVLPPSLSIKAMDYTINDAGETEYWDYSANLGMTNSPQVINIQLTRH